MEKTTYGLTLFLMMAVINTLIINIFAQTSIPDPDMWVTDGSVNAIAIDGDHTYILGNFTYIGPKTGFGVKLTTTNIVPDTSFPKVNGSISAAVPDGSGGWYIGGYFTKVGSHNINNIAHINGNGTVDTSWNPNPNEALSTIAIIPSGTGGNDIYVGGNFTSIGGQTRNYIAKLNDTDGNADISWNPNANAWVYKIAIDSNGAGGNDIYALGGFTSIGGQTRNNIAKLNNTDGNADPSWNPNANGYVYDIAINPNGNDIYVIGDFTSIDGQTRNYAAKLSNTDGSADESWNPNPDFPPWYITISPNGSDIYVGGYFTSIGGQSINYLAKLNNTDGNADANWNTSASWAVTAIAISPDGSDIYAGGLFTINGQRRNSIVKLNNINGNTDPSWNSNVGGEVKTIAINGNDIYVGGDFTMIGGTRRKYLAKLNNTNGGVDESWDPNPNYPLYTIAICPNAIGGSDIYVGGEFTSIGGQTKNYAAKLNDINGNVDTSWNPSPNNVVTSFATNGNDIYVIGNFTSIGGRSRNGIAKLNNTNGSADVFWDPNPNNYIYTISINPNGNDIYIGGVFTSIGGQTRNYAAKLNNTDGSADASWNPNPNDPVYAFTINGNDIYAAGDFTSIGGRSKNFVAKLNNTNGSADIIWDPNPNSNIKAVVINPNGSDIYVGGYFTSIGGQNINYLAKLNNTDGNVNLSWNPNPNYPVYTISINPNSSDIYVGGDFIKMDENSQPYFALFREGVLPVEHIIFTVPTEFMLNQNYPNPFNPTTTINYSIPKYGFVTIKVYDVLGKEAATIVNEYKPTGNYNVVFNAEKLSSGVYFYQLRTGNFVQTKKFVVMK